MSEKRTSVVIESDNIETFNSHTEDRTQTDFINDLVRMSRKFEDLDDMKEVIQNTDADTNNTNIVSQETSVNVNALDMGHGVPMSFEDALDTTVKTDARERVALLEAVLVNEGPHVTEDRVDYIIDSLFNQPAAQTKTKYKTLLVEKTSINALPGSDVRIIEPSSHYLLAAFGYNPDKYTLNTIPHEKKRAWANNHHYSRTLPVWSDMGTGYVSDSTVHRQELCSLLENIMCEMKRLENTQNRKTMGDKVGVQAQFRALKLMTKRINQIVINDGYEPVAGRVFTGAKHDKSTIDEQVEQIKTALCLTVTDTEIKEAQETLGVETTNDDEVLDAWREMVRSVHPDVGGSQEDFKTVEEAKEVLVKA